MPQKTLRIFGILLAGCFVNQLAYSQGAFSDLDYELEAGTFLSTSNSTPFWMRTNQYGEVPLESQVFTLRGQVKKEYQLYNDDNTKRRFSYGYGVRAVGNVGRINQVVLSEAYAKIRYGAFEFYAGRRKETVGLADSTLSAGSYIWSGNALPIPKIQISIPNYTPILKNGLIAIKGNYSHGWFGSAEHVKNYLLHQKSLYIRLGKPDWRLRFHGGFNHQVQWAGRPAVPFVHHLTGKLVTQYGNNLEAYLNIVTGLPINYADGTYYTGGGTYGEGNRGGNHLGTLDLAMEYNSSDANILLYRQSIYEDGSLYSLGNIKDGLNGIAFTRKNASQGILKVVVEYLYTAHQGGQYPASHAATVIPELRGVDDYFNNGVYRDGWTYKDQTIGSPFLTSLKYITGITPSLPENRDFSSFVANNRVKAFIVGIQSRIQKVDLTTRVSFSENLGTYRNPFEVNQTSLQQLVSFPLQAYTVQTGIAYDQGGLLEENLGFSLSVKRKF